MFSFLRANGSLSKSSILHVPLSCMSKIGLSFNNNCISAFPFSKSLCPLILSYSTSELLSITFSSLFRIISGKHRRKQQKDPKSNHRKCQQACSGIIYGRHVPGLARILGRRTRKKHPKDYSFRCFLSFPVYIHVPSKLHTKNQFIIHLHLFPLWLCPRPISNSQLHALPHFHLCPIYLVVFKGSY